MNELEHVIYMRGYVNYKWFTSAEFFVNFSIDFDQETGRGKRMTQRICFIR